MNEEFEMYIKKLKRMHMIYLPVGYIIICVIFFIFTSIINIIVDDKDLLFIKGIIYAIIILCVLGSIFLYLRKIFKKLKNENNKCYEFPFDSPIKYENISNSLTKEKTLTRYKSFGDTTIFKFMRKGSNIRIISEVSLYKTSNFNKKEYHNCLKEKYKEMYKLFKDNLDNYSASHDICVRYNLIFVDNWNSEIDKYINSFANKDNVMLGKLIYIVIYQNKMIIKPVYGGDDTFSLTIYHNLVKDIIKLINHSFKSK